MTENTRNDSSLYNFYQTNNLTLARSIIIKNSLTAEAMNKGLPYVRGAVFGRVPTVEQSRPESWRYYCHLAGEYHPVDEMMKVISLDTLQEIEFTKENMRVHRATWRNYALGTEYFNDLVKRFPEQELLIRGIINPISKEKAIQAEEYEILYYDTELIDHNEHFLIPDLQVKIRALLKRWDVAAYNLTDVYYEPMRMMILYMFIPSMLMNIRLKYAHTPYANKYHVWNYLGSQLELDRYRPYLTTEQTMWLYQNIRWVIANGGKQETFEEITEYVMSKRSLPISRFKIHRDVEHILENKPELFIERQQINLPELDYKTNDDSLDLEKLMKKELPTALHNEGAIEDLHTSAREMWRFGKHDNLNTKVIESHVEDYSTQEIFKLDDTLLDYWIYMALMNRFETIIAINNPGSAEVMTLNAKEALMMFVYALWRGTQPKDKDDTKLIGKIQAHDVYFPVMPRREQLLASFWEEEHNELYLQYIQDYYPEMGLIYSTEDFYRFCEKIHRFKYMMFDLHGLIQDIYTEGEVHLLTNKLKADYTFPLLDSEDSYFNYFKERGWLVMNLDEDQYLLLASEIFNRITGKDLTKGNAVESIQENMVRLMEKLSSYNVHFVKTINSQDVTVLSPPSPKIGLLRTNGDGQINWYEDKAEFLRFRGSEKTIVPLSLSVLDEKNTEVLIEEETMKVLENPIELRSNGHQYQYSYLPYITPGISNVWIEGEEEEFKRGYWIHNGSLFSDEFEYLENTLPLEAFKDRDEISFVFGRYAIPTPYDWRVFRERYGNVTPTSVAEDGSLVYTTVDETKQQPLSPTYQLDGFRWRQPDATQEPFDLQPVYRLDGFTMQAEDFVITEERPRLKDIADELLPVIDWTGYVFKPDLTNYRLDYVTEPNLTGFTWEQRDER